MPRYLITQSLLSAWAYTFDCAEGCEEDAKASFLQTLNRVPTEPTPAMLDGIAFENEVYAAASGAPRKPHSKWESGIQSVASILRGAPTQVKVSREINVLGRTFLVYGILDALKAGTIYDVKYKVKSFNSIELAGSYLNSPQHPAYFYCVPDAHQFVYLVSDGTSLYTERHTPEESPHISQFIAQFIPSIQQMGLLNLYLEKWEAR
jgi:hypothetical protein